MAKVSKDQNPRVDPQDDLAARPGPAQAGHQLLDEAPCAPGGVGRAGAHAGVQHLAGAGPGGQERVVAQHLGVAEGCSLLGLAGHLVG